MEGICQTNEVKREMIIRKKKTFTKKDTCYSLDLAQVVGDLDF